MVHCGYDPSGALWSSPRDTFLNFKYNVLPRPARYAEGDRVKAVNGFSAGRGHLAEARDALKTGAKGAGHGNGDGQSGCGSGDTSQRDELLAKMRSAGSAGARSS
jgi:hypothetical protein